MIKKRIYANQMEIYRKGGTGKISNRKTRSRGKNKEKKIIKDNENTRNRNRGRRIGTVTMYKTYNKRCSAEGEEK